MERILCVQVKDEAQKWLSVSGAVVREKGHALSESEGNILKPILEASIADSSISHVFEVYHCIDRCT